MRKSANPARLMPPSRLNNPLDGSGTEVVPVFTRLELQGVTSDRSPLTSLKAMKIVPAGLDGSVTDCPFVVHDPSAMSDTLKLDTVMPVPIISWLMALARVGKVWVGLSPKTAQRVPLFQLPDVLGTNSARKRSPAGLAPNTKAVVVVLAIGMTLLELQVFGENGQR